MNSQQKIINVITMCRRANKLISGFDAVKEAFLDSNISCVLVTKDISPKTLKEIKFICGNSNIPIIQICLESNDVYFAVGKNAVVMGVSDYGFAKRFKDLGDDLSNKDKTGNNSK